MLKMLIYTQLAIAGTKSNLNEMINELVTLLGRCHNFYYPKELAGDDAACRLIFPV